MRLSLASSIRAEHWNKQLRYHRLTQIEFVPRPYYNQLGLPRKYQVPDGNHSLIQV